MREKKPQKRVELRGSERTRNGEARVGIREDSY